jgi:xanthine dehydrogenase small subunit
VLVSVSIPKPATNLKFRNYKLSKRFDSDISAVCAAFAITLDGNTITHCRIAMGGMAATPKRASATERALMGKVWDEATLQRGMTALSQEFAPLTDMRATAEYRLTAARNLLYRFYLETRSVAPLSATDVRVFA